MYTVLVDNRWGDRCRNKDSMRIVPRVDEEDGTRLTGNFEKKDWNGRRSFDFDQDWKSIDGFCLNLLNLFRKNG